jgi:hypothetical protein
MKFRVSARVRLPDEMRDTSQISDKSLVSRQGNIYPGGGYSSFGR